MPYESVEGKEIIIEGVLSISTFHHSENFDTPSEMLNEKMMRRKVVSIGLPGKP